jgi:hypothetical protein
MPVSRETTSKAALSGGNNLATALSLNVCPYRATEILHRRPLIGEFYWHDNYSDVAGTLEHNLSNCLIAQRDLPKNGKAFASVISNMRGQN